MTDPVNQLPRGASSGTGPKGPERLRLYFESGWAFLIPYLLAYLLYAGLRWPVNPVTGGEPMGPLGGNIGIFSTSLPGAASPFHPPCLLHVYWFLHLVHLLLGGMALVGGWRNSAALHATSTPPASPFARLQPVLPWLCLALLFYLPGLYLEFPSDPWQHYARTNEWSWLQTVTEHSYWRKSSYFLAYSVVGQITPPALQLKAFEFFSLGCCLLLCWQYYRLARTLGFGPPVAMVFVFLQTLLFGNFIFGFYRYYGMSSSVFAQLGAVAFVRVGLDALRGVPAAGDNSSRGKPILTWVLQWLQPCALLLLLTAFNHLQGLGLAGLGGAALVMWRLIQWRRTTAWWLGAAAVLLSVAAVLWWPRHPLINSVYRPAGWLTAWYGFNLFVPSSPAFGRAAAILGLFGLFNLAAGVVLLRRNHIVGWLTVVPVAALLLPCVAIPFASSLATRPAGEDIVVFSRMLFAIPAGLALVAFFAGRDKKVGARRPHAAPFAWLLLSLLALLVVPAGSRYYNRLFNLLMVPADDLTMRHITESPMVESLASKPRLEGLVQRPGDTFMAHGGILATPGIGYVMNATGATVILGTAKVVAVPPSLMTSAKLVRLRQVDASQILATSFPARLNLFSPYSLSAYLSGHWLLQDVALVHAGQDELFSAQSGFAAEPSHPQIWLEWSGPRGSQKIPARGARVAMESTTPEERGRLDSGSGEQQILAGDRLQLRPVMRTLNGNGWRLSLRVRGPGFDSQREFARRPSPLGPETWTTGEQLIRLNQPGRYTVELTGRVLWPDQTYVVRYFLEVQPAQ